MSYILQNLPEELSCTQKTVAFSGYRPQKLPQGAALEIQAELLSRLDGAITDCLRQGYPIFLNGCMAGWDILAAEAVLKRKPTHPEIICVTVAPFQKSFFSAPHWTPDWKERALLVYHQSDFSFCLSKDYHKGVYYARDRFLVDHCALLVCYYDGKPGGTRYTVEYAAAQKRTVINLA